MKTIKKTIALTLGLIVMGGAASFAQSLADAKKAIDAEQYQKATGMLKTLTVSDAKEGEVYFNLGNVYLALDEVDSAKAIFSKGTVADPKNALNYVGLGHADLFKKDPAAAKVNFDKAIDLGKKDYETYMYIGKAYFELPEGYKPDYEAALPYLLKADELDSKDKDPEVFIALGDYWADQISNSKAYEQYSKASDIDPNIKRVKVQVARMIKMAGGYADAEANVKKVIEADPNYGPAYRELAEIQLQWSLKDPTAEAKRTEALASYRKYLDLTDKSFDSRFRYAQFLVYAADWTALAKELPTLKTDPSNPKSFVINRLQGYSAVDTKNFDLAVKSLNQLFAKPEDSSRIAVTDYFLLGRAYEGLGNDSLAIAYTTKGVELDTTKAEELAQIGQKLYTAGKYDKAAQVLKKSISLKPGNINNPTNYYYLGLSNYFAYSDELKAGKPGTRQYLVEADTAFAMVNILAPAHDVDGAYLYRARIGKVLDNTEAPVGLAVPHYLKYIDVLTVTHPEKGAANPKALIDVYNYLASYYSVKDKDKAIGYLNKTLALDPANAFATQNLKVLNGGTPPPPAPPKK
ncbi:tetratricopeptide repeat protein [Pedobacter sp. Du54]|uniref:tetratricopeptide repeat protein n=1 Tax=Pedobacter anseongensis TaxID=3133439 RepID=UPI0030AE3160